MKIKKVFLLFLLFPLVFGEPADKLYAQSQLFVMEGEDQPGTYEPFGRGGYRSPSRSYNPGIGTPGRTTPARPDNAVRTPANPRTTPATRTGFGGFFGGLFGGLAMGTILGSLFNPFAGFSLGSPLLSLFSLAIWAIIIYAVIRVIRRSRNKGY